MNNSLPILGNPGAFSRREKSSAKKVFKAVWRHFLALIGCRGLGFGGCKSLSQITGGHVAVSTN